MTHPPVDSGGGSNDRNEKQQRSAKYLSVPRTLSIDENTYTTQPGKQISEYATIRYI